MRNYLPGLALVVAASIAPLGMYGRTAPQASSQPATAADVQGADQMNVQHVRNLLDTMKTKDTNALSNLLISDAIAVDRFGEHSKADFLNYWKNSPLSSYEISDSKVLMPSPDVSVVAFKVHWSFANNAHPAADNFVTSVWTRSGGQWRLASWHETTPNNQ